MVKGGIPMCALNKLKPLSNPSHTITPKFFNSITGLVKRLRLVY